MPSPKQVLVAVLGSALTVTGLTLAFPAAPAQAVGGVFISEIHYDNFGTDAGEFVEITAPAGTDLSTYSLVRYNGSVPTAAVVYTTPAALNSLSGTAADQADGWGTGVVNFAVDGLQNGGNDGVALVHNGVLVEFVSWEGASTGSGGPANGAVSTAIGVSQDNSTPIGLTLQRLENGLWTGPVANTKGVPNGYDAAGGDDLAATTEPDAEATVDEAMDDVVLEATGGTEPYEWATTSTLPDGVSLSAAGVLGGTPTETGTFPITATVTDADDDTDDVSFTLTVTEAAGQLTIADIQGTGGATPKANETVTTSGIVIGTYPTGGFNGFYLQTPGADTTPGASDGVFVFGGSPSTFDESTLDIGDSVEVTGTAKEFGTAPNTLTEIELGASGTVTDVADLGDVVANTVIPGTDCALPGGSCPSLAALDTAKEEFEGEVFQPTGDFTLTDVYDGSAANPPNTGSSSNFGELGMAANSTDPLITPTEIIDAQATAAIAARVAYNNAHRVVLDDGSSTTYWNTANNAAGKDTPMPWYTPTNQVRVGAAVTFEQPVILDYRFGWKVQPTSQVTDDGSDQVSFEQDRPAQPEDVGGDIKIGTFNVLNYFTTLGFDYDAGPGTCSSFPDRAGNPIAVNSCNGNGPRGAWNTASFLRQQAKIVNSINTLDADIVSVEEIENSEKVDGADRDEALSALVGALNADAGAGTWAFVDSPAEASIPANVTEQDVIRTGFIYKPASVELVGDADMLFGSAPFANAREPFAQAFKVAGADDAQGFAVIVNHFKSKGSGVDDGTGQGAANPDRIAQAHALSTFADDFAAAQGVDAVFLTGDFNASSEEDPMQVLYADGYEGLQPAGEWSYSFDGTSQSLDHVLANEAASELVSGVDIWEVNANETVFNQYSRYNYNATNLYEEGPFGASDHNPEVIGINAPAADEPIDVQILGTNDFHGRLLPDGLAAGLDCNSPGVGCPAALLAGAVKQLRGQNPNTVFAAAGDLIGASTFESFIQKDEPTIDALNEAGLDVSSVGNHEFDQGYEDLVGRVQDRADWTYLAANVEEPAGRDDLAETWTQDFGDITVGFVGAVTEELPSLVSPAGIAGVTVTDIVDATNDAAEDLKTAGADIVVLLVHEGSPSTNCADSNFTNPATIWGNIVQNTSSDVDAIISGHTHLAYNCSFPVQDWVTENRPVTERPVVSSGQYGQNINKLVLTVDSANGTIEAKTQSIVALTEANFTEDPATVAIVHAAKAQADILGAQVLGQIKAPFNRAKLANGTTENRGGESTLGNLVAEVQRWATDTPETGNAEIAFMNPGGLRTDMAGTVNGTARDVTYKQAAVVQPFANTLVNMDMTGAQIEAVLEQQWQRTADGPSGTVPTRPFLRLGASKGFTYTYVETPVTVNGTATFQGEVTGMWLNGTPIQDATSYSVTVNSFLASGGDNFRVFANGTGKADTGKVDLQAMVDYLAEFGPAGDPLAIDYTQRAVEVHNVAASYAAGDDVEFDVASWTMSTADDVKDTAIQVKLGNDVLGTATPNNTIGTAIYDQYGTAHVDVTLPANTPGGATELTLVGQQTGTEIAIPITVKVRADATVTGTDLSVVYGSATSMHVTVSTSGGPVPTGGVTLKSGGNTIGTGTLSGGEADVAIAAASLPVGANTVTIEYAGDAEVKPGTGTATVTVTKAASTVIGTPMTMEYGSSGLLVVSVGATGVVATGQVTVKKGPNLLGTGTLTNGQATVTIPANALPIGTHTVTITYAGDANVQAGTGSTTIKVVRPSAMVTGTDTNQTYGQATTMHVVVTGSGPVPTGSVVLKSGTKTIGVANLVNGQVDVPIAAKALTAGTYPVTINYSGNATYGPSTGTATLTVTNVSPTVTGTPTTVDYGKATTMLVKVTAPGGVIPTGTVTLTSGGVTLGTKNLGNGQATVQIPAKKVPVGVHTVTISYSGDANVQAGTGTSTLTVQKATSTVTANNATQRYGHTGTMHVRVAATGVVPTGTVTLKNGTTVLGTGQLNANGVVNVVLTANTLPVRAAVYTVTVEYAGDAFVKPGTGSATLKVNN